MDKKNHPADRPESGGSQAARSYAAGPWIPQTLEFPDTRSKRMSIAALTGFIAERSNLRDRRFGANAY